MRRLTLVLVVVGLLGAGVGPVLAVEPSPGPPYPDPIDGVRVYDFADVLAADTIASVEVAIVGIEERTGAQIAVYTQVKPESDTPEAAERDAAALIDQWGIGQAGIDDGLAILFDLDESRCHGQVQLHAGPGNQAAYLDNEARQAVFDESMLPALRECDFDGALLAAMDRTEAAMPAVEQAPSPPPWFGGRVEMPEHGFAWTVPEGWVAFDLGDDLDGQVGVVRERYEAIPANGLSYLGRILETAALEPGLRLLAMSCTTSSCSPTRGEACGVYATVGVNLELDELGGAAHQRMADSPKARDVEPMETIVLPAGQTMVLRATVENAYAQGQWGPITMYLTLDGSDLFLLSCSAYQRPDDDWLSIVETFEFLPAEEQPDL